MQPSSLASQSFQSSSQSYHSVKKSIITTKRTIIPDDIMEGRLIGYEKKIQSGKDFDIALFNCSFELNSLDTCQPLVNSKIVETVFENFDKFTDLQKNKVLSIIQAVSATAYKNVVVLKNLENLMKVLTTLWNENSQEKILLILKEYMEFEESITEKILKLGGMEMIIKACESKNTKVLYECSVMILKIVLFGGKNSVNILMKNDLSLWVLPFLHIYEDHRISYFAYFTLIYLRTIWKINHEFFEFGLLDNIVGWLFDNEIELKSSASFNCKDTSNLHKKLLRMLLSKNRMAQTFGTFQICCELSSNMDGFLLFNDEAVIRALRRIAVYSNTHTSKFAKHALIILRNISDNRIQRFPPKNIAEWNEADVQKWLNIFGFSDYTLFFINVDGEALMRITENELKSHYFIANPVKRKVFLEERSILGDESKEKAVKFLKQESILYDSDLATNIGSYITNGQEPSIIDAPFDNSPKKKYDVFISYRRQGGADLASLIFVYLKGKNQKVFFDVQSLRAGKFADKLKNSIQQSQNFILLLTADALKRCKDEGDWIKIEIEMALKSGCNIIPITKDFDNKAFEDDSLPDNIKKIKEFNQIFWHHDTQDSCLTKILEYMEERINPSCPSILRSIMRKK